MMCPTFFHFSHIKKDYNCEPNRRATDVIFFCQIDWNEPIRAVTFVASLIYRMLSNA